MMKKAERERERERGGRGVGGKRKSLFIKLIERGERKMQTGHSIINVHTPYKKPSKL